MEIPKLVILLCCSYHAFASHDGYTIPVEHYETELQDLGEHVDVPEQPVRIIKITKTVAVKVPVPYPVKVVEKVPYPVHINKPYPVPVPHIVRVPHGDSPQGQHEHEAINYGGQANPYQVQEIQSHDEPNGDSYGPAVQSYNGNNSGHQQSFGGNDYPVEGSHGNSYEAPSNGYYGNSGASDDAETFETRSYDQAIQDYLKKANAGGKPIGLNYKHY